MSGRDPAVPRRAPGTRRPASLVVTGVVAAAVAGGAWLLHERPDIPAAEEWVFRAVNGLPVVTWWATWPVMQLGNIVAPALVALGAGVAFRRWRPPVAVLLSGYGAWAAAQVVKDLSQRGRPAEVLDDVILRESARGLGFVSGHAAIAAGMAAALWPYLGPRGRVVAALLASWVGLGRLLGGAHLPLDVVGGAALGVLVGVVVHAVLGVSPPDERTSDR